jgi:hypothetical protein
MPNLTVAVDVCPSLQPGVPCRCPVYISVKIVIHAQAMFGDPIENGILRLILKTLEASSTEIAALIPRFKILETSAGALAAARSLPASGGVAAQADLPGEVQAIEPDYAGKVLSRSMLWGGVVLALVPLAVFVGGMALLGWSPGAFPEDMVTALKATSAVIGIAGLIVALRNPRYIANKILERRLRRELAGRPKRLVNPDDPRALFVELVPKANWGRVMPYTANDAGLLLLDEAKREVLFEGDRERFRIPADAITYCVLEREEFPPLWFLYGLFWLLILGIRYSYVVLSIENPKQFLEAPIRVRSGEGLLGMKRKKVTTELLNRIQQMRSTRSAGAAQGL